MALRCLRCEAPRRRCPQARSDRCGPTVMRNTADTAISQSDRGKASTVRRCRRFPGAASRARRAARSPRSPGRTPESAWSPEPRCRHCTSADPNCWSCTTTAPHDPGCTPFGCAASCRRPAWGRRRSDGDQNPTPYVRRSTAPGGENEVPRSGHADPRQPTSSAVNRCVTTSSTDGELVEVTPWQRRDDSQSAESPSVWRDGAMDLVWRRRRLDAGMRAPQASMGFKYT